MTSNTVAPDGTVFAFLLPPVEADGPQQVTGGGEFPVAFRDAEEVEAFRAYLSSDTWANNRVGLGGVISANKGLDPEVASSELLKQSIEILQSEDTTFRFDGSDLMPGAVGADSFWKGIVAWVGGAVHRGRRSTRSRRAGRLADREVSHRRGRGPDGLRPLLTPNQRRGKGDDMTTGDLLGKILQLVMGLVVFAAIVGLLIFLIDKAPKRGRDYWHLALFLSPAILLLAIGLIYPAIRTTGLAFLNNDGDFTWNNFIWMFTQPAAIRTLINTVVWVLLVPTLATAIGLAYAVFIDRSRGERYFKALLFMPMAISFVGAGIIWKFVYEYRSEGREQIGLLNALVVAAGGDPVQWLQTDPINTILLIVVMIWIQTGFAMVVLSAAIKGIPTEQIEAAQLDGTNAWQRFRNVTIPGIRGSLVVVLTTISIATLKVFDIVRTMTAGNFDTSVIANEMYTQAFRASEVGRGSALALILFVLVLPIVIYNVNVLRKQREIR